MRRLWPTLSEVESIKEDEGERPDDSKALAKDRRPTQLASQPAIILCHYA
jgi:hypothetical protein